LIVFFIVVSNVEEAPQRKAFPTEGAVKIADTAGVKAEIKNAVVDELPAGKESLPKEKSAEKVDSAVTDENFLVKNISSEILTKSGFKNIVVKPRPFNGMLFDQFDLAMLSYLNIVEKSVIYLDDGNETEVLKAYEFDFSDDLGAQEIYDFLKAKIKDKLGVTINQTNQFGLSSFYINFNTPLENVFLVVKTRTNVYALSYPKAKLNEISYFDLVSNLLKELI
jgi:hypothetical protein